MSHPSYIHLRLHTEYSLSDGILRIKDLCRAASEDQMPAIAVTDLGNLFGMVKFFKEARKYGIKPIIGCDIWVSAAKHADRPSRLILLVQNKNGYLRLCDWVSRSHLNNQKEGKPVLDRAWFEEDGTEGLIALSGGYTSDINRAVGVQNLELAHSVALNWAAHFPERFYIEIHRLGTKKSEHMVWKTAQIASELNIPVVATHPVQFLNEKDFTAHEARVCIANGEILGSASRPRKFSSNQYFLKQSEMVNLYHDLPEALENSVEIAKRCNFTFELGVPKLPNFPTPASSNLSTYLEENAEIGLTKKINRVYPNSEAMPANKQVYIERLKYELNIISQMEYSGYFLVVADFINWAKNNGIPVGPGRGSGAGSLVAFALEITDLDPIKYGLLFERFLNPERVSMPDFDIDFCQYGRDRVIDYVRKKYGEDSVSQIATFGTMAAKAVVRDVARVMEWSFPRSDELAKLIPFSPGKQVTIKQAKAEEPRLREREKNDEETRELLRLAEQLEGLPRNVGMHAGGVLIAPKKLTEYCPLYLAAGSESVVSQLDKNDVEDIGLVKFDFLGLTTLTILDLTIKYLHQIDPSANVTLENISLDDPAAYRIFANGNTAAVFQFESKGMRELLVQAKPDRLEDIIALVALYRPGPMDVIPDYIARKHGQRFNYPDPRVESILQETYGIMVYQEQVMQMAQIIGGYSLGGADILRRAMGKKKPEEMANQRDIFRKGASENGLSERKADEIFDLMEKFAGYGFNKSHAAAYALIAYKTAFMKAHYVAPFMAANLSLAMDDTDRVEQLISDVKDAGIILLPPNINEGDFYFTPTDLKSIRFGLGAIKGTGESAIQNIVNSRKTGPFDNLFDFCERIDRRVVNRRSIESLVRAGAFDTLNKNRCSIFSSVGLALEAAEQAARSEGQANLFSMTDNATTGRVLLNKKPWGLEQSYREEKNALGFYFSGHLFDVYREEVRKFVKKDLSKINADGGAQIVAGVIHSVVRKKTQRGSMAIITLDDGSGKLEFPIFNDLYAAYSDSLLEDALVIFKVRGDRRKADGFGRGNRLLVDQVYSLSEARTHFASRLTLKLEGEINSSLLKQILEPYNKGQVPVRIMYKNNLAQGQLQLGDSWRLNLEDELLRALGDQFMSKNVLIEY